MDFDAAYEKAEYGKVDFAGKTPGSLRLAGNPVDFQRVYPYNRQEK